MPLPFLIAGALAIGVGAHIKAKVDNNEAESLICTAKNIYEDAKRSMEIAQNNTAQALARLGQNKKSVLDTSMTQFLRSYEHVKPISMQLTTGINELDKFSFDEQTIIQVREMTNIYNNALKGVAAGATTGVLVSLGASGAGLVGAGLATAGKALLAGEIGTVAAAAGSTASLAASLTPFAAVAAPVVMFTGISAAFNASDNLDKAKTSYSEAKAAAEQMKVAETLCNGIEKRSDMFNDLLTSLNNMFIECSGRMIAVVDKKRTSFLFFKKRIKSEDLTEDEIKLFAVTRSLAGAIKAVLDTPIMTKDGELDDSSQIIYEETQEKMPLLVQQVEQVKSIDYNVKPAKIVSDNSGEASTSQNTDIGSAALGIGIILAAIFAIYYFFPYSLGIIVAGLLYKILPKTLIKWVLIIAFVIFLFPWSLGILLIYWFFKKRG